MTAVMNSPSFCLSDIIISLTLLKENFDAYGILVFLSFNTLNMSLDWLAYVVSDEKP